MTRLLLPHTSPARRLCVTLAAVAFAIGPLTGIAKADPPSWAPAHGYRAKHGAPQNTDTGEKARYPTLPPGLEGGRCHPDRLSGKTIGLIVGATVGGAIGGKIAGHEDRVLGTALGAVVGALIGSKVGSALSENSRACIGETLQYAAANQTITWRDPDAGLDYALTPSNSVRNAQGETCRIYTIKAAMGTTTKTADGRACRYGDNAWQIVE